jgi:hypothetical protein
MTIADDAAKEQRRSDQVARPFRVAALIVVTIALTVEHGYVIVLVVLIGLPALLWGAAAADRARYRRRLSPDLLACAAASMRGDRGRRYIGVLNVERSALRWAPLKRFRKRGATEVVIPWTGATSVSAARISPSWSSWMVRSDALAVDVTDGPTAIFFVTSPKVIYAALNETGHSVLVPK